MAEQWTNNSNRLGLQIEIALGALYLRRLNRNLSRIARNWVPLFQNHEDVDSALLDVLG